MGLVNPQRIPLNVIITGESGHDVADVTGDSLHVTLYGATGPISIANPLPVTGGGGGSGGDVNIVSVSGSPITLGQATMTGSFPVVIASDQTPIPVTGSLGVTGPTNVAEFGGNPVVTGVGPGGPGIPRVTISNDSVVGITGPQHPLSPSSPSAALVGTVSSLIVPSNPNRTGLVLINVSSNYISFGLGVPALVAEGITLNPFGSVYEMDPLSFTTDAIFAISNAGNNNTITIQEFD